MRHAVLISILLALALAPLSHAQERTRGLANAKKSTGSSYIQGEYRALLIGNNEYQNEKWPTLTTAVRDVEQLANVLIERYGFAEENVIVKTNATRREMLKGFNTLAETSKPEDNVLIYYAGHGEYDELKRGWWIPVDGEDRIDYISNEDILGWLRAIPARHKLLIADSCFSGNMLTRGARDLPEEEVLPTRYVIEKTKLRSVQGLSSGGNEPVSDGGAQWEGHSIFAYHLIAQLRANQQPYFSAALLGFRVSELVANDTASIFGQGQSPVFSPVKAQGDQGGDFFFYTGSVGGGKVALVFAANADERFAPYTEAARELIRKNFAKRLESLEFEIAESGGEVSANELDTALRERLEEVQADRVLLIGMSGERVQVKNNRLWEGTSRLELTLQAYRLVDGNLVKGERFELKPQRLPIREWSDDPGAIQAQFERNAKKVVSRVSNRKLKQFLEQLRE